MSNAEHMSVTAILPFFPGIVQSSLFAVQMAFFFLERESVRKPQDTDIFWVGFL